MKIDAEDFKQTFLDALQFRLKIGQKLYVQTFEECIFRHGLLPNVILIFLVSMVTNSYHGYQLQQSSCDHDAVVTVSLCSCPPPPPNSAHRMYLCACMISLYIADWFL
jgi:hypothetical protein